MTEGAPSVSMTPTVNGKNVKLLKFVETILSTGTSLRPQIYFLNKCSIKGVELLLITLCQKMR